MKKNLLLILIISIFAASCAHNPERFYFGNYSEAEQLYDKKDYERALQKYQAYIDENPEGNLAVIASFYMAKSHAELGHTDEAKRIFEAIIHDHPQLVWANLSETQLKNLQSVKTESPNSSK